jgi:hypothetical protein
MGTQIRTEPLTAEEPRYVARIVRTETGEVSWQSEPCSRREAERMAAGASRNLNWDAFHIEVERYLCVWCGHGSHASECGVAWVDDLDRRCPCPSGYEA